MDHDLSFRAMGTDIRVLVGPPAPGSPNEEAPAAAARVRTLIETFDSTLSRFSPDSSLTSLNSDPRPTAAAPALLRSMVSAALWAARESDGLVDPVLVDRLEAVGYGSSRDGSTPADLIEALSSAPPRRPAHPSATSSWRSISVDDLNGTVTRPPGTLIDSGGVGKGLAADAAAELLADRTRFCVSAGGDLRIGGSQSLLYPFEIELEDPFGGEPIARLAIGSGGLATSGIGKRIWRSPDGGFAHHLIDPSTGTSAWTGVVQATALAPTALEAETLSKRVVLGGPGSVGLLERGGGVVVLDDGTIELIGSVAKASRRPRGLRPAR